MHEIPKPQVLDPERPLRHRGTEFKEDDRPEAELLSLALTETCEYAEQLWNDLNGVRAYLLDSLPPDPRAPGAHPTASASPSGPDDETGWDNWINAFAAVSSALCGPKGDSGFGLGTAREHAQRRRTAPVITLQARRSQQSDAKQPSIEQTELSQATELPLEPARSTPRQDLVRNAITVGLAVLALRGLLPRRRDRVPTQ